MGGGAAAVLVAYFDASERDSSSFSVAGVAYGNDRAKKATHAWRGLWGDTVCHMTELHTRKEGGTFADWEPGQAGDYLKDSISIINRYASAAVAVSCNVGEVARLARERPTPGSMVVLDGFSSAYALCCHMAMRALAQLCI